MGDARGRAEILRLNGFRRRGNAKKKYERMEEKNEKMWKMENSTTYTSIYTIYVCANRIYERTNKRRRFFSFRSLRFHITPGLTAATTASVYNAQQLLWYYCIF